MNNKITLPELVSRVAQTTNTTERMSELFLRELFATITEALIAGESVTIKDLGTFKSRRDASGNRSLLFAPAKKLAEVLNQPFEAFAPLELDDAISESELAEIGAPVSPQADVPMPQQEPAPTTEPRPEPEQQPALPDEPQPEPEQQLASQPATAPQQTPAATPEPEPELESAPEPEPPVIAPTAEPPVPLTASGGGERDDTLNHELLEVVKQEVARKSLWKGIVIGLIAGALLTLVLTQLFGYSSTQYTATAADTTATPNTVAEVRPPVTDTISSEMYLTKMAIKHYGRQEFWVYIYEENKSKIDNPNRIEIGTVMVIPPPEKYDITKDDSASVARAAKLSTELFNTFAK